MLNGWYSVVCLTTKRETYKLAQNASPANDIKKSQEKSYQKIKQIFFPVYHKVYIQAARETERNGC